MKYFLKSYVSFFPFFIFWFLVTFGDEVMKIIRDFGRQDGQDRKKREDNHATKATKRPKTKRQKYGMNNEQHIDYLSQDY